MRLMLFLFLILIPCQSMALYEMTSDELVAPYGAAMAAKQAGNLVEWRDQLNLGLPDWENIPSLEYQLAEACALTGQPEQALKHLENVAKQGYVQKPDTCSSFSSLKDNSIFKNVCDKLAENAQVISQNSVAFTLPSQDFFPEGITCDPRSGDFFAGSLSRNQLLRWSADGKQSSLFLDNPDEEIWLFAGIKVHRENNTLWACRTSHSDSSASAVFVYDLDTGNLVNRFAVDPDGAHFLNDLAFAEDGTAYVTDSDGSMLWRLKPGENKLTPFLKDLRPYYPNGILISPDQKQLFVAHVFGLLRIDLVTEKWDAMKSEDGRSLAGIDGMSWYRDSIISIHNGSAPTRVCRLRLSNDYATVEQTEILERGNPLFSQVPTTGVVVGNEFHFIANSQMLLMGPDRQPTDIEALQDGIILKIDLEE
ncbi:MAG: SMP-30/gluconolactonase/LRE family protein [bacterium]|nr:SMP-30/gluconolactonase/LRE family protein [bacterium]